MPSATTSNAYYSSEVAGFASASAESILGNLAMNSTFAVDTTQLTAWEQQIAILKVALVGIEGSIFLEFVVPRIGSRVDAVLVSGPAIFVIEFKVGATKYNRADVNQAWDYALDLKNFHQASHGAQIFPMLVATEAPKSDTDWPEPFADGVYPPVCSNSFGIAELLKRGLSSARGLDIDATQWGASSYQPTPTIIEAAQALYSEHSVEAIARSDSGARNLRETSKRIEQVIEETRAQKRKSIIFVTGVPGAGKTLVGLNIATSRPDKEQSAHAVFLSGNGPLVQVLTEALTRDEVARLKKQGKKVRKGDVGQKVKAFIQNVHHFRDEGLNRETPPSDHVVIFDEAQRAWNREMTADFMRRKKGRAGFSQSEPEFLISYLDRRTDWAVVICLVGGGQEINRGEAGISAWLDAVHDQFINWHVYISPELRDSEYAAGRALATLVGRKNVVNDDSLHLAVSMRSFRAEKVSQFVKAVLDVEMEQAKNVFSQISEKYPIVLTRDLEQAKAWVRANARGSERYGLVASSEALRLKPHAINVKASINPVHWFLNGSDDTRSSYYLEDPATEFQVQGLELDWVCVTWDADFRFAKAGWSHNAFRGSRWTSMHSPDRQQYLKNAYRVLLTRARQGMVIFVPAGAPGDPTRAAKYYDSTFDYLAEIGIPVLST